MTRRERIPNARSALSKDTLMPQHAPPKKSKHSLFIVFPTWVDQVYVFLWNNEILSCNILYIYYFIYIQNWTNRKYVKNKIVLSEFSLIAFHIFLVKVSSSFRAAIVLVFSRETGLIGCVRVCVYECACVHIHICVYTHTVSSPYLQIRRVNSIHCTTSFYIRDLSIHGFWCPWGLVEPVLHRYQGMTVFYSNSRPRIRSETTTTACYLPQLQFTPQKSITVTTKEDNFLMEKYFVINLKRFIFLFIYAIFE